MQQYDFLNRKNCSIFPVAVIPSDASRSPLIPVRSRRIFLRDTLFGSAVLVLGAGARAIAVGTPSDSVSAGHALRAFDDEEAQTLATVASRLLDTSVSPAFSADDVVARADAFLAGADPEILEQFHLLLYIFDNRLTSLFFAFSLTPFSSMSASDQDEYLRSWMTSTLGFRRTAFQGLKRLVMSMYYTDARSWTKIGYDGDHSEAR